jgi:hypothetical protein
MKKKLNPNFKFRSGKYTDWTVQEVFASDPRYLNWVYDNKPQMLKGAEVTPAPTQAPDPLPAANSKYIRPSNYDEAF